MLKVIAATAFWAGVGAVLLAAWYLPEWGFLRGEITQYSAYCKVDVVDNRCAEHSFTMSPRTFKVSADTQNVVSWVQGSPPDRTTDCAIRDRTNWSCTYSDKSGKFGFNDGVYFEESLGRDSDFSDQFRAREYRVSKWQFLQLRWSERGNLLTLLD